MHMGLDGLGATLLNESWARGTTNRKLFTIGFIVILVFSTFPESMNLEQTKAEATLSFEIVRVSVSQLGDLEFIILANNDVPTLMVSNNRSYSIRIDDVERTSISIKAGSKTRVSFKPPDEVPTSQVVGFTFRGSGTGDVVEQSLLIVTDENLFEIKERMNVLKEFGAQVIRTVPYGISDTEDICPLTYAIALREPIRTMDKTYTVAYVQLGIRTDCPKEVVSASVSLEKDIYVKFPSDREDTLRELVYAAQFLHRFSFVGAVEFRQLLTSVEVWNADVHDPIKGIAASFFNGFAILAHQAGGVVSTLVTNPTGGAWQAYVNAAGGVMLDFAEILTLHDDLNRRLWELESEKFSEEIFKDPQRDWEITDEIRAIAYELHLTFTMVKEASNIALEGANRYVEITKDMTLEQMETILQSMARENGMGWLRNIVRFSISKAFEDLILGSLFDAVAAYYLSITAVNHASNLGQELLRIVGESYGGQYLSYSLADVTSLINKFMAFNIICTALVYFIDQHLSILARPDVPQARTEWQQVGRMAKQATTLPGKWYTDAKELLMKSAMFRESSGILIEGGRYLVYPYKAEGEVTILPGLRSSLEFDQIYIETDDSNLPGGKALGLSILQEAIDAGFNFTLLSLGGPAVNVLSRRLNEEIGREFGIQFLYDEKLAVWGILDRGMKVGEQVKYYTEEDTYDYAIVALLNIRGSRIGFAAGIGWDGTKGLCEGIAIGEPNLFSLKEDHVFLYRVPKGGGALVQMVHRTSEPQPRLPWETAMGFVCSDVNPKRGVESTQFIFSTTYIDASDKHPERIAVGIDGKYLTMTCVSPKGTSPRLGLRYEARWSGFERGRHIVHFVAMEGVGKVVTRSADYTFSVGKAMQAPEPELWLRVDSPLEGSSIYGMAEVSIAGGDFSGAPVRLYFYIDDEPLIEITGPVKVNTKRFANGTHTLTAQVRGGQGKYREASVHFTVDNPPFQTPKLGLPSGVDYRYTSTMIEIRFKARNIGKDGYVSITAQLGDYARGPDKRWMKYREEFDMTFSAPVSQTDTPLALGLYDESTGIKEEVWHRDVTVPSKPDVKARVSFDKTAYFVGESIEVTFILDANYEPVPEWSTALFQVSWGLMHYVTFPNIEISSKSPWCYTFSAHTNRPGPILAYGYVGAFDDKNASNNHVYESVTVYPAGKAIIVVDTYSPAYLLPGGEIGDTPRQRKDVEVFVDGKSSGHTDNQGRAIVFTTPGTHTVRVSYDSVVMTKTCTVATDELVQLVFYSLIPDIGGSPRLSLHMAQRPCGENETLSIVVEVLADPDGDIRKQPGGRIFGNPISYAGPRYDLAFQWLSVAEVSTYRYMLSIDTSMLPEGNYTALLGVDDSHHVNDAHLRELYEGYLNYSYHLLFLNFSVFHPPTCEIQEPIEGQRVSGTIVVKLNTATVDPDRSTIMVKFGSDEWGVFPISWTFELAVVTIDTTTVEDGMHTLAFVLINEHGLNATCAVRLIVCNSGWGLDVRFSAWVKRGASMLLVSVVDNLDFPVRDATVEVWNGDHHETRHTEGNGSVLIDVPNLGTFSLRASYPSLGECQGDGIVLERIPQPPLLTASFKAESGGRGVGATVFLLLDGNVLEISVLGENGTYSTLVPASLFIGKDYRIEKRTATLEIRIGNHCQNISCPLLDGALVFLNVTLYDLPPTSPGWVTAVYIGGDRGLIAWEPNCDADFARYEILLGEEVGTGVPNRFVVMVGKDANATTYELTGLSRGSNYSLVVCVVDIFERTCCSKPVILLIPTLGFDCTISLFLESVGEDWAVIGWAIDSSDEPLKYTIHIGDKADSIGTQYNDVFIFDTSHVNITGLLPASMFYIRLIVHFEGMVRIISEPLQVTTLDVVEPPVEHPIVAVALEGSCSLQGEDILVSLSWNQIDLDGFEAYVVLYRNSGISHWVTVKELDDRLSNRWTMMGLNPSQTYDFCVKVRLINGTEYASNIVTLLTPTYEKPLEPTGFERPRILTVIEEGRDRPSLEVEWEWNISNAFVRFELYISTRLGDIGLLQWSSSNPMVQSARISHVDQNTDYYITVRVVLNGDTLLDSHQSHIKTKKSDATKDDDAPIGVMPPLIAFVIASLVLMGKRRGSGGQSNGRESGRMDSNWTGAMMSSF